LIRCRLLLTQFCGLMLIACSSPKATSPIDAVLASAVESGKIPGVIAVAATSDEVFYEGMAGTRDLESGTGMTADTIFQIYSMTKAITSVAVMQLVEQGKVELDRAIGFYVPRFADRQVLVGFDEKGEPILRPAESSPTVRQLLTHTSGYAYEIWNADAARYAASGYVSSILNSGDGFLDAPLMSDPGTKWEYGISTDILGVMVEEISGQSLDDYFREHVLKPLRMTDTYFVVPDEKLPRLATAYSKSEQGELTPIPYSRSSGDFFSGGGGLKSTAGDYIRFMQAILNDGELDGVRILSAASVDLIAQNHIGDLEAADSVVTSIPYLSNDFNFMPDSADKFGLGFLINTDPVPGGRSAGSLAWAGLYNSYYWIDRNKNICGVLITQILPFYDSDVLALLNEFETAAYAAAESAGN